MQDSELLQESDPREVMEVPHHRARPGDPCVMVIFGAGGDMTRRLMMPSLYNLSRSGLLPAAFVPIGVDLAQGSSASWRDHLYDAVKASRGDEFDDAVWQRLGENMVYVQGDLTQPELYGKIEQAVAQATQNHGTRGNAIFYLAVADRFFGTIIDRLAEVGLTREPRDNTGARKYWRRVVIEKPFGHSLEDARALNNRILRTLDEDQIFRIDHYLGKETVQSIMAFRFANGLFEPIWNRDRIDHVQITAAETVGVEKRGKFYEATGALRDMVPNHIFTLVSMVAMEPTTGFDAAAIRTKKAELFAAMPPIKPERAVRGQYGPGSVLGKPMHGYREEPDVSPTSSVETYCAARLEIDNWRWAGVPFYFRTGKHLARRSTEIAIRFRKAPYAAFHGTPVASLPPNWLVLSIAPEEGISLQFEVKRPGPLVDLSAVKMDFRYDDWFPKDSSTGYETLIYDVMIGDPTLFMRADMVEHAWRIVQPVLDNWAAEKPNFPNYASGSEGPAEANTLFGAVEGKRGWRPIDPGSEGRG